MTAEGFIRDFTAARLEKMGVPVAAGTLVQYAVGAAHWQKLRRRYREQAPTPGQRQKFDALTVGLRALSADLGLPTCVAGDGDAVAGVTDRNGFLPGDPHRIVYSSWGDCG